MPDPSSETQGPTRCCAGLYRVAALLAIAAICGGLGFAFWPQAAEPAPQINRLAASESTAATLASTTVVTAPDADSGTPAASKETEDERLARKIIGRWKTVRDSGPRDLVVKSDGTAEMTINIESTLGRLLFQTKQMVMNIDWRIENSILHFKMVDGKPKTSVDLLMKGYGDSISCPIIECSHERLLVKDEGDDPDHDWSRVGK